MRDQVANSNVWIDDECMSDGWQICLNIKYANCKEGQSRFCKDKDILVEMKSYI